MKGQNRSQRQKIYDGSPYAHVLCDGKETTGHRIDAAIPTNAPAISSRSTLRTSGLMWLQKSLPLFGCNVKRPFTQQPQQPRHQRRQESTGQPNSRMGWSNQRQPRWPSLKKTDSAVSPTSSAVVDNRAIVATAAPISCQNTYTSGWERQLWSFVDLDGIVPRFQEPSHTCGKSLIQQAVAEAGPFGATFERTDMK